MATDSKITVQPFLYEDDCTSMLEISIACFDVPKMDMISESDPFVTISQKEKDSYTKIGETEVKQNNKNPKFETVFQMKYCFEEEQILKFTCEDFCRMGKNEFIGEAQIRMGELVSSIEPITMDLKDGVKDRGKIQLFAEKTNGIKSKVKFSTQCKKLDRKCIFGRSNPYSEVRKLREDKHDALVYKSEVIKNTLNPTFKPFEVGMWLLCSGDIHTTLKFDVFDWNMAGNPDPIGTFSTSLAEINFGTEEFEIFNPEKQKKKGKNSGIFQFTKIEINPVHTFVDYLKGGLDIQLIVAIDFTSSNGKPANPKSLHYIGSPDNEYVEAIKSVGNVLMPYDTGQKIPALGFGAKLPPNYAQASHCFSMNGKPNPEVNGVAGILNAYKQTLSMCRLSGPTLFGEILTYAKRVAEYRIKEYAHTILLIITDGTVDDMTRSADLIVESSGLPLSVVIVGVGGANFSNMHKLDADDEHLIHSKTGQKMRSDIVQFVPMREVKNNAKQFDLAKEVFAKVPGQLTHYMSSNCIPPRPPVARRFPNIHPPFSGPPYPLGKNPQYLP